mgnify:CR=1 FL=1
MMSPALRTEKLRRACSRLIAGQGQQSHLLCRSGTQTDTAFGSLTSRKSTLCAWILIILPFGYRPPQIRIGSPSFKRSWSITCESNASGRGCEGVARTGTHPLRQVHRPLLGNELEHSDVRVKIRKRGVGDLERDGELDVELRCARGVGR